MVVVLVVVVVLETVVVLRVAVLDSSRRLDALGSVLCHIGLALLCRPLCWSYDARARHRHIHTSSGVVSHVLPSSNSALTSDLATVGDNVAPPAGNVLHARVTPRLEPEGAARKRDLEEGPVGHLRPGQ